MGWGTHEKELPPSAYEHPEGPKNQICLARMGINTWVVSWVPNYRIRGMVVEMDNFAAALASEFEHKYVDHGAREAAFSR